MFIIVDIVVAIHVSSFSKYTFSNDKKTFIILIVKMFFPIWDTPQCSEVLKGFIYLYLILTFVGYFVIRLPNNKTQYFGLRLSYEVWSES